MRWQHTKATTLSDEQVESHIREWNESAEKMEKMSADEAKRFVGASQPDSSSFLTMSANMLHKIRKEAPSKDAEKRMMDAWKRHTRAYQKIMAMLTTVATPSRKTTTTVSQLDSRTYLNTVVVTVTLLPLYVFSLLVGKHIVLGLFITRATTVNDGRDYACHHPLTYVCRSFFEFSNNLSCSFNAYPSPIRDIAVTIQTKIWKWSQDGLFAVP